MNHKFSKYISNRFTLGFVILTGFSFLSLLMFLIFRVDNPHFGTIFFLLLLLYLGILYFIYQYAYKPYKETNKVLKLFADGYLTEGVFEIHYPLTKELEQAMGKFQAMQNKQELISLTKKQSEYLALQNQINPHFLYNTLEGIRSEAIYADIQSVAEMTEALATFFRYTISNTEHLVTIEDELSNIENYYIIQQYRFGERLGLSIDVDENEEEEDVLKYRLPKLTLQPIVENAIYHGIERKVGRGMVKIKIITTQKRLIITVSDDGLGISEEQLNKLNLKLRTTSVEEMNPKISKGGIAIINVNNRIKLLYGEEYGIFIYSKQNVGTDVEITLPLIMEWENL